MNSTRQNQNERPPSNTPSNKNENPKRRKVAVPSPTKFPGRQTRNNNVNTPAPVPALDHLSMTREDVDTVLNEKMKLKARSDFKGRLEQMTECSIKWFQQLEEGYMADLDSLKNKCAATETETRTKVEEMETSIAALKKTIANLEEELARITTEKNGALDSYNKEKEDRMGVEKSHAFLARELEIVQQQLTKANQGMVSLTAVNRGTSKTKLAQDSAFIIESLSSFMEPLKRLQEDLRSARTSRDEAVKQNESMSVEVGTLRVELEKVREDRDHQLAQVKSLSVKSKSLEEQIKILQHQLAAANEKLQVSDLKNMRTASQYETLRNLMDELKERLAVADKVDAS